MYKVKHIVPLNKYLLKGNIVDLNIEGTVYSFQVDDILTSVIELTEYIKHESIRNKQGPLEEELMGITYGKSKSQMEPWQYAKSFTEFKMNVDGDSFKFEVKGVGEKAVRVNLYISFKQIDEAKTNLTNELKNEILELYSEEINDNKAKLDDLKRKDDEKEAEREKIREEIRKEEEAMKEKYKDIAHLL